jgi:hypothetical protein
LERGSDKHGPRVDEELDRETRSLQQGAPVESRATAGSLDLDDAETRADIARFLTPSAFPADREALLADAQGNQAPAEVLERLQALPAGRAFENVQDVWGALGGTVEHRF